MTTSRRLRARPGRLRRQLFFWLVCSLSVWYRSHVSSCVALWSNRNLYDAWAQMLTPTGPAAILAEWTVSTARTMASRFHRPDKKSIMSRKIARQ